jgi:Fe-S cluster assembly iron-binding protein IscA
MLGGDLDWNRRFAAGFVFANRNAKSSCGCGRSFTILMDIA